MRKIAVVFGLMASSFPAQAQVMRCTIDGEVVYQQGPCQDAGRSVNLSGAGLSYADRVGPRGRRESAARDIQDERAREAVLAGRVYVGMAADHALASWGPPSDVNSTLAADGRREQWVYRLGVKARYLYVSDGVVTTIQSFN